MEQASKYAVGVQNDTDARIQKVGFGELSRLNRLFIQSIDDGFDYFNDSFKKTLAKQHNLPRLAKAYFSPKASLFVAKEGSQASKLHAYCFVRQDGRIAYLYWMYVQPAVRGTGLGSRLLDTAMDEARRRNVDSLQLITHDKEAFYQRAGFVPIRHVSGLLGGADMVMMEYRF